MAPFETTDFVRDLVWVWHSEGPRFGIQCTYRLLFCSFALFNEIWQSFEDDAARRISLWDEALSWFCEGAIDIFGGSHNLSLSLYFPLSHFFAFSRCHSLSPLQHECHPKAPITHHSLITCCDAHQKSKSTNKNQNEAKKKNMKYRSIQWLCPQRLVCHHRKESDVDAKTEPTFSKWCNSFR